MNFLAKLPTKKGKMSPVTHCNLTWQILRNPNFTHGSRSYLPIPTTVPVKPLKMNLLKNNLKKQKI